jgi:CRISPR system Cascade subunit CasE
MTGYLLSKATLAPQAQSLAALLAEAGAPDGGHRLVWTLFSRELEDKRDFLYRAIDERTFLILSNRPPADPHGLWSIETKLYAPEPRAGEHYSFILRANPAVKPWKGTGAGARRADAIMHAKKAARSEGLAWDREAEAVAANCWLFAREAHLGVRFDREAVAATAYRQIRVARRAAGPVRFSSVDYEGRFEVVDKDRLYAALVTGIGKAKAFGNGLMLIRRA